MTDAELVKRYQQNGDLDLLGQLYQRYMPLVYGVCLKYLQDESKAEDAVMNIFEELVGKVREHDIAQFRGWLYVLAKNHCRMYLRKHSKVKLESLNGVFMQIEEVEHPMDEDVIPELEALRPCLEKLPGKQRQCIDLFYYQNKSYREIAEITGEALGRVRSNIQNGRRNLRICLEKKNEESIKK